MQLTQKPDIFVSGVSTVYDIEHLARIFYPTAGLRKVHCTKGDLLYARAGKSKLVAALRIGGSLKISVCDNSFKPGEFPDKKLRLRLCRMLYELLKDHTGINPPWGMLTGVRPTRLTRNNIILHGEAEAEKILKENYSISEEKYSLISQIVKTQQPLLDSLGKKGFSLYVSIPFCPTRCSYCSFVSRTTQRDSALIIPYLGALEQELKCISGIANKLGLTLETIYIGGGTPTALDLAGFEALLSMVERYFDTRNIKEYTVEAGRPDCTGRDKLALIKKHDAGRISINPQTMQEQVLKNIGRKHSPQDIVSCYNTARELGHSCINMDLIAGLPGDTISGFAATLADVIALGPENITVHTLTMKRASNMSLENHKNASNPAGMIDIAAPMLYNAGYRPYYLYRQKSTVENLENTGWSLPGQESLYNVCIMEETSTILAAGAGAVTKLVAGGPGEDTVINRIYNYKYPAEYIEGIAQVLSKKQGVEDFYARIMDT